MCQKFSGLPVNPSPERLCGFPAAPDTRLLHGQVGGRGKGNYPEEVDGNVVRQGTSVGTQVSLQNSTGQ